MPDDDHAQDDDEDDLAVEKVNDWMRAHSDRTAMLFGVQIDWDDK